MSYPTHIVSKYHVDQFLARAHLLKAHARSISSSFVSKQSEEIFKCMQVSLFWPWDYCCPNDRATVQAILGVYIYY